ncbi:MAG: VanZ family protein, partial [Muribaculaceae bacterium]|nr:VanZ family protein [Muribaculaceae bacterium]
VTVAVILWLTLVPRPLGDMKPELFPGADKVVHAIMFGGLALMILTDCSRSRGWHRLSLLSVITAAAVSTLFGIVIELLQREMDLGRSYDFYDILADAAGAVTAALLWYLFTRFPHGRKQES